MKGVLEGIFQDSPFAYHLLICSGFFLRSQLLFFHVERPGGGALTLYCLFFLPSLLGFLQMFYVSVCGQSRLGFT